MYMYLFIPTTLIRLLIVELFQSIHAVINEHEGIEGIAGIENYIILLLQSKVLCSISQKNLLCWEETWNSHLI